MRLKLSDFSSIVVPLGPREFAFADLVEQWRIDVLRVFDELENESADDNLRSVFDLWGSYYIRSAIESVLRSRTSVESLAVVRATDELLRSFTRQLEPSEVLRITAEIPGDEWWWLRFPSTGRIGGEIKQTLESPAS